MNRIRTLSLLLCTLLVACSDEGPVSGPGTMTATVVGPNGDEGAALVILVGDNVGALTAVGGTELHHRVGSTETQVVLINPAGGVLAFQLAVADTTQPPQAVIQEVAGPDDELRSSLVEYSLVFSR